MSVPVNVRCHAMICNQQGPIVMRIAHIKQAVFCYACTCAAISVLNIQTVAIKT